jgi:hypothetical protein
LAKTEQIEIFKNTSVYKQYELLYTDISARFDDIDFTLNAKELLGDVRTSVLGLNLKPRLCKVVHGQFITLLLNFRNSKIMYTCVA